MVISQLTALIIAFILDLCFGDPDFRFHPIRIIGNYISLSEKVLRKIFPKTKFGEIVAGGILVIKVLFVSFAVPFLILFFSYRLNRFLGIGVESVMCYFLLAARSLSDAALKVYKPLKIGDTETARKNVSMIVGRDTESLDDVGITKAAVETVAENTSDGITAPIIYMAIGGGVLGFMYKAVNTMDSMVGYKNDRYINFGKMAAKLDDIANFIPSRISAYLMILSAYILGFDGKGAFKIHKRDCRKHASPNSAQTESVTAGALGIQLAGDAYYFGKLYKKSFIGDKKRDIEYEDIKKSIKLMYLTSVITLILCALIKLIVGVL